MLNNDTPPLNFREAKKHKTKKPWKIEFREPNSIVPAWRNWCGHYHEYETKDERDQAYEVFVSKSKTGYLKFEYRKVDQERKTK